MKFKELRGYYIVQNWFKGKWVYHYYPMNSDNYERILNETYSFKFATKTNQ